MNWFLKEDGAFLWPGFSENMRALKWCFERAEGSAKASKTPIGLVPTDFDFEGLQLTENVKKKLFAVDMPSWKNELTDLEQYFTTFGSKLPEGISTELRLLKQSLS